ncbi:MAG: site-2 protease family protein [Spirochaetes bacterium]|jgi:regulator of sigma E protease|nr:site-2 protease family protein [Spirochaetota bacterium]
MDYVGIIFIIGLVILVHEAGHFAAARLSGIPIALFSVGFGPKLIAFRRGETEYRLSAVPLGGYVLPAIEDENEFFAIPVSRRLVMTLGGPAANVAMTLVLLGILNAAAGGTSFTGTFLKPFEQTAVMGLRILDAFGRLFSGGGELSGIVGIVAQGTAFVGGSAVKAAQFAAVLSLNLAIFNLLPLPALDGGKALLYLMEKVHPSAVKAHVPLAITGWVLILGLMLYTTWADVLRYAAG